jgi:hypothetical protein
MQWHVHVIVNMPGKRSKQRRSSRHNEVCVAVFLPRRFRRGHSTWQQGFKAHTNIATGNACSELGGSRGKEHAASSLIRLLQAHVLLFVVAAVFRQFARRLADPTFAHDSPGLYNDLQPGSVV